MGAASYIYKGSVVGRGALQVISRGLMWGKEKLDVESIGQDSYFV